MFNKQFKTEIVWEKRKRARKSITDQRVDQDPLRIRARRNITVNQEANLLVRERVSMTPKVLDETRKATVQQREGLKIN